MKRPRRSLPALVAGALVSALIVASAACSNQGEGERCEVENGNDDCKNGLICVPADTGKESSASAFGYTAVNAPFNNSDRCCPTNRATASHPACTVTGSAGGDAAPPADATVPPTDGAVSAPDATVDAGEDAADADIADAPDDG